LQRSFFFDFATVTLRLMVGIFSPMFRARSSAICLDRAVAERIIERRD
jgi:hypothetical protein